MEWATNDIGWRGVVVASLAGVASKLTIQTQFNKEGKINVKKKKDYYNYFEVIRFQKRLS